MKKKNVVLALVAMVFSALVSFGADIRTDVIRIRSFIDSKDIVHVQGDRVWFTHVDGEVPGNWGGFGWPTYVNETEWTPVWEKYPVSDVFRMRDPYVSLPMAKFGSESISVFVVEPAGVYGAIVQYPDEWNDWTLSVLIDNSKTKRALWTNVEIAWDESLKFRRIDPVDVVETPGKIEPIVPKTVPSPTPVGLR